MYLLASSFAGALLEGLFEQPAGYCEIAWDLAVFCYAWRFVTKSANKNLWHMAQDQNVNRSIPITCHMPSVICSFPIEIRFTNDEGHYGFFAQRNP